VPSSAVSATNSNLELLLLLLFLLLSYLLTAIELSLDGSIPYIGADKTVKNKYT
jgi:hypothetical protein